MSETEGYQIKLPPKSRGTSRPPGIEVCVLDSAYCYEVCGSFASETLPSQIKGVYGRDQRLTYLRAKAHSLADQLEQEYAA